MYEHVKHAIDMLYYVTYLNVSKITVNLHSIQTKFSHPWNQVFGIMNLIYFAKLTLKQSIDNSSTTINNGLCYCSFQLVNATKLVHTIFHGVTAHPDSATASLV